MRIMFGLIMGLVVRQVSVGFRLNLAQSGISPAHLHFLQVNRGNQETIFVTGAMREVYKQSSAFAAWASASSAVKRFCHNFHYAIISLARHAS